MNESQTINLKYTMSLTTFARTLLALITICANTGCNPSAPKPLDLSPQLTATVGERTILAQLPNPARIQAEGDVAMLFSGSHKIAVERERVLLDGKELVKLPAATKTVGISVSSSGTLSVVADMRHIATAPFPK